MICSSVNLLFLMSAILLNGGPLATSHWYGLGGAGHPHHCHILETGNDSYRFKRSSAVQQPPMKKKRNKN